MIGHSLGIWGSTRAPAFNVLSLSPALWLDASDLSTLFTDAAATTPATNNGDNIGAWQDKSGNGYHFTQSGATRPTLSISSGVNSIAFTGGQNLDSASNSMITSGNQDFTFVIVYSPNLGSGTYGTLFGSANSGKMQVLVDNGVVAYARPFGLFLNANVDLSSDSYSTGVKLISIQRASGNITGWQGVTQKDTVANTNSVYTGAGTASVWSLGANTSNTEALEGSIREVIVVNSAISAANLTALQIHLIAKHGAS